MSRPLALCLLGPVLATVVLATVLATAVLELAGCRLVDQRTFVADADKPPVPKPPPPAPPAPPAAALVTIHFPSDEDWRGALSAAVGLARARKPDVLFTVQTAVPTRGTPAEQTAALSRAAPDAQAVAEAILADGADRSQIELTATTDRAVEGEEIRIYVR